MNRPVPRSTRVASLALVLAFFTGSSLAHAQAAGPASPGAGDLRRLPPSAVPGAALAPAGEQGAASAGPGAAGPFRLTLHEAIARGLSHNLAAVVSSQRAKAANAAEWNTRSGLLPTISASIMDAREQINLEAYGFPVAPGASPIIGPFDVSDRRISVNQQLINFSAIEAARGGRASTLAAGFADRDVREQVVVAVSSLYLQLVATRSRIDAARAQMDTAVALEARAAALKQAGMTAGVETIRAQVQTEQQRQRVIYLENEFEKQKLQLARGIGWPLDQAFDLADVFPYRALEHMAVAEAVTQALAVRPDYKAALEQVRAAEFNRLAAVGSLLPSLGLAADIGMIGPTWGGALKTFSFVLAVHVPIFQGGREVSRIAGAKALLEQERAQLADVKARVEYEVRAALLDVDSADRRVTVARRGAELATLQLAQAQDRFAAGVATHVEVVQAQEAVATASENLIASQFAHNLAKSALARALGVAASSAERFLGGQQ